MVVVVVVTVCVLCH